MHSADEASPWCVAVQRRDDGRVIVAVCNPLMKRVHGVWQFSVEMMLIDSSEEWIDRTIGYFSSWPTLQQVLSH